MCVKVEHFIKINLWYRGFETNSGWDVTGINYSPLSVRAEQGAEGLLSDGEDSQYGLWKPLQLAPPWNKLSVEVLVTREAQKVELIENGEVFPGEISKWDKIVKCSAFKFPGNSWRPNQRFHFGAGCTLTVFSNWKVQFLYCLLHVSHKSHRNNWESNL